MASNPIELDASIDCIDLDASIGGESFDAILIPGVAGKDGREVIFRTNSGYIQWSYVDSGLWENLVSLDLLKGEPGENGKEVELRSTTTHLQWRYIGDSEWINLIAIVDLRGEKGDPGEGVPAGGLDGQVLTKKSDNDFDTEWQDSAAPGEYVEISGDTMTGTLIVDAPITDHNVLVRGSAKSNYNKFLFAMESPNTTTRVFGSGITGDTNYRFSFDPSGRMSWGDGTGTRNKAVLNADYIDGGLSSHGGRFKAMQGLDNKSNTLINVAPAVAATDAVNKSQLDTKENSFVTGTVSQYLRGDKTWQPLDKTTVGLSNVDNTADINKPVSTATQTALNTKANTSSLAAVATSGSYDDLTNKPATPVQPTFSAIATTLAPGSSATANISGTQTAPVINIGVPSGLQGASGMPNTDLVGVGQPNGAVSASPGAIYRNTDRSASWARDRLWIKDTGTGNTGWIVLDGDTLWRRVDSVSFFKNTAQTTPMPLVTARGLLMRRIGNKVEVKTYRTAIDRTAEPTANPWIIPPAGFAPDGDLYWPFSRWDNTGFFGLYWSGVAFFASAAPQNPWQPATNTLATTTWSWTTAQAWPTTLPGSAG